MAGSIATGKAFTAGSEWPAPKKDVLRIYSMRLCPFAQKTRMVLAHKNIPHETVNIHLQSKPDWFLERFPLGLVPCLEINEKKICDSAICNDYLDEVYPGDKLTPSDPYIRATQRVHMEHWNKVVPLFYKYARSFDEQEKASTAEEVKQKFAYFEQTLKQKFFGGDSLSMLDIYIWPHMERLLAVDEAHHLNMMPRDLYPKLTAWKEAMMKTDTVKAVIFSPEIHMGFLDSYMSGSTNYDLGL